MLGPMVIDVAGIELTAEERKRLQHPLVGQVVLFTRNFESPEQLSELSREIRALREPPLLICVDHEGGRGAAVSRRILADPEHVATR